MRIVGFIGGSVSERTAAFGWPVERGCGPCAFTDLRGGVVGAFIFKKLGFVPSNYSGPGHSS